MQETDVDGAAPSGTSDGSSKAVLEQTCAD